MTVLLDDLLLLEL